MVSVQDDRGSGADAVVAALLRGSPVDAAALAAVGVTPLLDSARRHDVVSLVADALGSRSDLPAGFGAPFQSESLRAVASDLAAERELRRLLDAFAEENIPLLLVKGSHLAYTHYHRPDLRARIDTDLLIARDARDTADGVLTGRLGYEAEAKPSGDFTATQKLYTLRRNDAVVLMVDLHWRLASPQVFAEVLTFEELLARSVPIPALGPAARGPSSVDALLIACMHRVAHHHDEAEQLKWLFDIHLVASGLSDQEWNGFASRAAERRIAAVCLDGLERSVRWFGTVVPPRIQADARLATAADSEQTAAFLHVRPHAQEVLDNLRATRGWRGRLRLVGEHLFPGSDYMRRVYAPGSTLPLPLLYAGRAIRGLFKWLRPRGTTS